MFSNSNSVDSINYQPAAMDNAISYLNNALSSCQNAKQCYTNCTLAISNVVSSGYTLPASGEKLLADAVGLIETLLSDANKIKIQLSGEESSSGVNLEELYDTGDSSWSLFDWDGDGKSLELFDWDGDGESLEFSTNIKNFDYIDFYGTDDGMAYILEFITDSDYRAAVVEDIADVDNDGVRDYVEFTQDMSNYDYNEFYSQPYITDSGIPITGDMLNFFADPFAGVIEFGGDVITDAVVDPARAVNRVVSSAGNLFAALFEGVSDWGEAVIDTMLVLNSHSMAADMQMQANQYDMYGNLFGNDIYSQHADMLRESSEPIVLASAEIADRDYTDSWFDALYSTEICSNMNELSYGVTKRGVGEDNSNGILYNVTETVGYYLPILALTHGANTYGVNTLGITDPSFKTTMQALFTWSPSFGKNFESNYGGEGTIEAVNDSIFRAGNSATVDSLIVYLAGKISKLEVTNYDVLELPSDVGGIYGGLSVIPTKINLWESLGMNPTNVATFIKMLKPVANETIDTYMYGDEFTLEEDGVSVMTDMVGIWFAEEIANYVGNFYHNVEPADAPASADQAGAKPPTSIPADYYDWLNGFLKDFYKRVGKEGSADLYEDEFVEYLFDSFGGDING